MNSVFQKWSAHPGVVAIVSAVVSGVITFCVGFTVSDYSGFRSDQRELLKQEFSQVLEQSKLISKQLSLLSGVAKGDVRADPAFAEMLGDNVRNLFADANLVTRRIPETKPEFDQYSSSMITLVRAAEQLSGPENGRPFVEAVSQYLAAEDAFEAAVSKAQGTYF
jgi:hypothetical protein